MYGTRIDVSEKLRSDPASKRTKHRNLYSRLPDLCSTSPCPVTGIAPLPARFILGSAWYMALLS